MFETDFHQPIELLSGESNDELYELTCAAFDEDTTDRQNSLPHNLDDVTPGPFLGAILSSIDLSRLGGHDVITVMKAHQRQVAHHQAGMYAAMYETAHCTDPDTTRRTEVVNEFAPEEIGAALTLTRRMADQEHLSLSTQLAQCRRFIAPSPQVTSTLVRPRSSPTKAHFSKGTRDVKSLT
jgi:hypothetical protein